MTDLRIPAVSHRAHLAGLALTLVLALAGCGGGGGELTAEELVAEGDELCRTSQERYAEIQAEPPAGASAAAEQTDELIAAASDELDGLRDLEPPSELAAAYDRYLDAKQDALDLLEEGSDAAEEQDAKRYGELQSQTAAAAPKRLALAEKIGFEDCSVPQGASTAAKPRPG